MLVLTRAPGERILIDGGIVVTVLSFNGRRCRIGIEAPSEVKVLREEVADRDSFDRESRRNDDRDETGAT
jgi:carbon storage regulator